jgi:hypothetical protein
MFTDEFDSHPYCTALQEREYRITQSGIVTPLLNQSSFNLTEVDILKYLEVQGDWIDFGSIRSRLKYIGKWSVSCILSYLISLGYVQERITW